MDDPAFQFGRHFTPHEANELLPRARQWLRDLRAEIDAAQGLAQGLRGQDAPDPREVERLEERKADVAALLARFEEEGIEVKGIEPGLLDFPALLQGREVYLCWCEPEGDVTHWHPLTTGFASRQPIERELLGLFEWCN